VIPQLKTGTRYALPLSGRAGVTNFSPAPIQSFILKTNHMQWLGRRGSSNVEDRRGISGGGLVTGGGILGVIIYFVYTFLSGGDIDPSQIPQVNPQANRTELSAEEKKADDQRADFVKVVLADTEDVWNKLLKESGQQYQEPTLVSFS
jgi:predicted metalloprotease